MVWSTNYVINNSTSLIIIHPKNVLHHHFHHFIDMQSKEQKLYQNIIYRSMFSCVESLPFFIQIFLSKYNIEWKAYRLLKNYNLSRRLYFFPSKAYLCIVCLYIFYHTLKRNNSTSAHKEDNKTFDNIRWHIESSVSFSFNQ